ncbi:hypothetical protein ONZ51_g5642 [Trametes cubensis]|uniref:Aminoglycoside phosphotransferase domain-containing protein n=1 Tax=Trametes cubensis TaxID=1111947 RepID=A0AAD7TTT0_9APHY|nr:hypothetical protein ONZ51_g5642 [Trametes cubensis]
MLPFDLVLKSTRDASPWPEADNMRFVAQNTSIPVPHVFDVVQSAETTCDGKPREGYFVMSQIHGISLRRWISKRAIVHPETARVLDQLDACIASGDSDGLAALKALFPSLPPSALDLSDSTQLIEDLRRALTELRSIPPPHPDVVSGLHNRPLSSIRCTIAPHELGRFDSQLAFKNKILNHVGLIFEDRVPALRRLAEPVLEKHHRICFTHADLHAQNILVRDDGQLAGIIDWEHAGWYPEYWEYTMIEYHMPNRPLLQLFWDTVHPFGEEPYTEELALEWALWRSTGDKSIVGPREDDLRCPR